MNGRQAYEALYGTEARAAEFTDAPSYQGGICPEHGPAEVDRHARCVLCGNQAELLCSAARLLERGREIDRAHEAASDEDGLRTVVATEAVSVAGYANGGQVYWPARWQRPSRRRPSGGAA